MQYFCEIHTPQSFSLDLSFETVHIECSLRLNCGTVNDIALLCVKLKKPGVTTKRFVLMVVSSVFDPLYSLIAIVSPLKIS